MKPLGLRSTGIICSLALAGFALTACQESGSVHSFEFETMGTVASGQIGGESGAASARLVRATYDSVNVRLSAWSTDSEVGCFNTAGAGTTFTASAWLGTCLQVASDLGGASGGAFDPSAGPLMRVWGFHRPKEHLPSLVELDSVRALLGGFEFEPGTRRLTKTLDGTQLDLGGIAKGFAVDRAVANLECAGVTSALIDLGGNIFALGQPAGRDFWVIGVRDPLDRSRIAASVTLRDRAVATSGSYEKFVEINGHRYGHIMNPATGRPAEGLLSATVICRSATLADGLSTTLFVLGPDQAIALLREHYRQVDAVLILPGIEKTEARILVTAGLADGFTLSPAYRERYTVEVLPF